jgi:hypothetical protein
MEMKMKHFQKYGKGVFTCGCCNRETRETNKDHGALDLCGECYELAGIENYFSDNGTEPEQVNQYRDTVLKMTKKIERRGGSLKNWKDLLAIVNTEQEEMEVVLLLVQIEMPGAKSKATPQRLQDAVLNHFGQGAKIKKVSAYELEEPHFEKRYRKDIYQNTQMPVGGPRKADPTSMSAFVKVVR